MSPLTGDALYCRIEGVAAHIFMRWPDAAVSDAPDREAPCANFSRKDFVFGPETTGGLLTPNHYADYLLWPPCTGVGPSRRCKRGPVQDRYANRSSAVLKDYASLTLSAEADGRITDAKNCELMYVASCTFL